VLNEKLSFVATLAAVESWHKRDPAISDKLIEDKANGPAVMSALETAIPGIIPVTPLGSKESRVIACTPVFARKGLYLRRGQGWTEEAFNQLTRFPKYGADDIVDVITQALGYFLQNSGGAWLRYMGEQYKFSGGAKRERANKLGKNR
jgi:predicted phage terminase large subunit-like protein